MAVRKSKKPVHRPKIALRASRTRGEIVLAAAAAFSRKGFRATTMKEIADAAGYTAASLYTYFRSKEEIFAALLRALKDEMLATYDMPAPQGSSFAQRLELLLWAQFSLCERRRDGFMLFDSAPSEVVAGCRSSREGRAEFLARTTRWMKDNATVADLGTVSVATAASLLMGICHAHFLDFLDGTLPGLVDRAPVVVRFFLHGVSPRAASAGGSR